MTGRLLGHDNLDGWICIVLCKPRSEIGFSLSQLHKVKSIIFVYGGHNSEYFYIYKYIYIYYEIILPDVIYLDFTVLHTEI